MVRMLLLLALSLCLWTGSAGATDYDPLKAGHPLRIVAYGLHPVGVALDRLIFRPAWMLGQIEPLGTLFGVASSVETDEEAPRTPPGPVD